MFYLFIIIFTNIRNIFKLPNIYWFSTNEIFVSKFSLVLFIQIWFWSPISVFIQNVFHCSNQSTPVHPTHSEYLVSLKRYFEFITIYFINKIIKDIHLGFLHVWECTTIVSYFEVFFRVSEASYHIVVEYQTHFLRVLSSIR